LATSIIPVCKKERLGKKKKRGGGGQRAPCVSVPEKKKRDRGKWKSRPQLCTYPGKLQHKDNKAVTREGRKKRNSGVFCIHHVREKGDAKEKKEGRREEKNSHYR